MWYIPLWAYVLVVVISLGMIVGLLGLVFKMAKPSEDDKRGRGPGGQQLPGGPRGPTGKEKRKEKRQDKAAKLKFSDDEAGEEEEEEEEARPQQRGGGGRGGLARMQARRRGKPAAVVEESSDEEEDAGRHNESADEDIADDTVRPDKKIGAKKLAKLQRKEEAKQIRQAEEERRAQRKAREEQDEAERLKRKQDEKEQERLEREDEERRKKEREERELEEFNKWKGSIEVEAEGSAKAELEEKKAKLVHFADHVKREKVVLLEDLAITFSLQTQEVIDELTKAEDERRLTGVIDERGKYIYISPEEMDSVAKFIKYRGRVSIRDIAAESNKLIKMVPEQSTEEEEEESAGAESSA